MQATSHSQPPVTVFDNAAPGVLAYSIPCLAQATSISKSSIYEEAKAGRLKLTHRCGRTIVLAEDARAWLRGETVQAGDASILTVPVGVVWHALAAAHNPTAALESGLAERALAQIVEANPDLGRKGFRATGDNDTDFATRRRDLTSSYGIRAFQAAVLEMAKLERRDDIDPGYDSIRAAGDIGHPIEGGHIIAAAIYLGVPILRPPRRSVVLLGVERLPPGNKKTCRHESECTRQAWALEWGVDVELVGEPAAEEGRSAARHRTEGARLAA